MFTALKAPPADDPVNSARIFDSFCKRGHRLARQHLFFRVFRSEFEAQPASVLLICLNKIGFVLRKCRQHKPGLPIVLHLLLAISRNALSRRTAARDQVWPVAGSVARLRRCAPALARPLWSRCRGVAAREDGPLGVTHNQSLRPERATTWVDSSQLPAEYDDTNVWLAVCPESEVRLAERPKMSRQREADIASDLGPSSRQVHSPPRLRPNEPYPVKL